jgi:hypothetical protein
MQVADSMDAAAASSAIRRARCGLVDIAANASFICAFFPAFA